MDVELWRILAGAAALACLVAAARPLGPWIRLIEARWNAAAEQRRAACPNRPLAGDLVVLRGGFCTWCGHTHDQRSPGAPNIRDAGPSALVRRRALPGPPPATVPDI